MVIVRLFRPFDMKAMVNTLPPTVERVTVLDRCKEPGAPGDPLYLDVRAAIGEAAEANPTMFMPLVLCGRYGLGSAEFSPAMVKAVYDNMVSMAPKNHFCVGPNDDVTHTSLSYDKSYNIEGDDVYRAMFYGLGSDGTVGANKNTIKIIGTETDNSAQGYFVYDSKKSGSMTVSHLRFGENQVVAPYLINKASFVACHNFTFLNSYDMLANLEDGGTFLLTTTFDKDSIWNELPAKVQQQLIDKKAKFYIIDAIKLGIAIGLGARINMIMQTAFFLISGILKKDEAIDAIKTAIKKTYGKKGDKIVNMNYDAVDAAVNNIVEVALADKITGHELPTTVPAEAPDFVKDITAKMIEGKGEEIKVSEMPADGRWPTATTQWEKRNIAVSVPEWDPETCIQCGRCSLVCPHGCIRLKIATPEELEAAGARRDLQDCRCQRQRICRPQVHYSDFHGGLRRLHALFHRLSGSEERCRRQQDRRDCAEDDHQYRRGIERVLGELEDLSGPARNGQRLHQPRNCQRQPAQASSVRVLRCLRRLR